MFKNHSEIFARILLLSLLDYFQIASIANRLETPLDNFCNFLVFEVE